MGRPQKLTKADIDTIITLYTTPNLDGTYNGMPAIAKRFEVTYPAIRHHLIKNGVEIRPSGVTRSRDLGRVERPPLCKCGCGQTVEWSKNKKRWLKYCTGHYRQEAPYKIETWLREQYIDNERSANDIAKECEVSETTIYKAMNKFGIERRDSHESRVGLFTGENNPAWKDGSARRYNPSWKHTRRVIKRRDGFTCQVCQRQFSPRSKNLHCHHIDGNRTNDHPDNLATVCKDCHPLGKDKETREYWNSITIPSDRATLPNQQRNDAPGRPHPQRN